VVSNREVCRLLNVSPAEADNTTVRTRRRLRALWIAALLVLAVAAVTDPTPAGTAAPASASAATTAAAPAPCGWRQSPPTTYAHVIWVVLENHSYSDLIGRPGSTARAGSPYLNSLAEQCGLALRSWGITHPSLPNYLALASGRTAGVTTSCTPASCPQQRATIFSQLQGRGDGWRVYADAMGTSCRRTDAYPYVVRHNPATYFPDLSASCQQGDVPLGSLRDGRLVTDLAAGTLASFSLVVPNQCHNGHDCPASTGDAWLSQVVPKILAGPDYQQGETALFVTWDEGAGGTRAQSCALTPDRSCHVVTIAVSPTTVSGTRSTTHFDHYALLETTGQMLGLPPLGHAADAATTSMRPAFGL
jgi:phosphatidylinositol-3-phosphatase